MANKLGSIAWQHIANEAGAFFLLGFLLIVFLFSSYTGISHAQSGTVFTSMTIRDLDGLSGITINEQFAIDVFFEDRSAQSIFSAYANVSFDATQLRVDAVQYATGFDLLRLGQIGTGVVSDLGAVSTNLTPTTDTLGFTLLTTRISGDATSISLDEATGQLAETTVFGIDGDQRGSIQYTSIDLEAAGIMGDCNRDGLVNAGDLSAVQLNTSNSTCDTNGDNVVNVNDSVCIRARIFNLNATCTP